MADGAQRFWYYRPHRLLRTAILGIYPLTPDGAEPGKMIEFAYRHLLIRIVVDSDERGNGVTVFADIQVTAAGLAMRVVMPQALIERGYDRYLFTPWQNR